MGAVNLEGTNHCKQEKLVQLPSGTALHAGTCTLHSSRQSPLPAGDSLRGPPLFDSMPAGRSYCISHHIWGLTDRQPSAFRVYEVPTVVLTVHPKNPTLTPLSCESAPL